MFYGVYVKTGLLCSMIALSLFLVTSVVHADTHEVRQGPLCQPLGWLLRPLGFCPKIVTPPVLDSVPPANQTVEKYDFNTEQESQVSQSVTNSSTTTQTTTQIVERIIERIPIDQSITNQYITNPVIREIVVERDEADQVDLSNYVQLSLFDKQVDRLYESFSENITDLADEIANDLLAISGNASFAELAVSGTSTFDGLVSNDLLTTTLTVDAIFIPNTTPALTTSRLYNTGGNLYWNGSLIAGGAVGSWDSAGSDVYRLTGNVGIGITPTIGLDVRYNDLSSGYIARFSRNDFEPFLKIWAGNGNASGLVSQNQLKFFTNNQFSNPGMTILTNNNVGIGTTSPGLRLDVWGNMQVGTGTIPALFVDTTQGFVGINNRTPVVGRLLSINDPSDNSNVFRFSRFGSLGFIASDYGISVSPATSFSVNAGSIIGLSASSQLFMDAGAGHIFRNAATDNEYARIDTAGNLLVGTTISSARLVAQSTSTADILNLYETGGNEVFTVLENGNVGVGITSPATPLAVLSDISGNSLRLTSSSTPSQYLGFSSGAFIQSINASQSDLALASDRRMLFEANGSNWSTQFDFLTTNSLDQTLIDQQLVNMSVIFAPTSGTADFSTLRLRPTINQSGSANGITRGLYIEPAFSNVGGEFRAIDISNNSEYALYQSGASAINYLAGNVGIGTPDPEVRLDVVSGGGIQTRLAGEGINDTGVVIGATASQRPAILFRNSGGTEVSKLEVNGVGGSDQRLGIFTGSLERFSVMDTGNIGIGTTTPGSKLQVVGDIEIGQRNTSGGTIVFNSGGTSIPGLLTYSSSGFNLSATAGDDRNLTIVNGVFGSGNTLGLLVEGNVAIGTTSPTSKLAIRTTGSTDILNLFETSGEEVFTVLENGNVGIGTTSPETKMHVNGNIKFVPSGSPVLTGPSNEVQSFTNSGLGQIGLISASSNNLVLKNTFGGAGIFAQTGVVIEGANVSLNAGTQGLHINNTGNIGVGTTTPSSKLDVWGGLRVGTSSIPLMWADTNTNRVGINNISPEWGIDAIAESKFGPNSNNYLLITDSSNKGGNFSIDSNVISNSVGVLMRNRKDFNTAGDDDYSGLFRSLDVNSNGSYNEQVYGERSEFDFNNNSGSFGDLYYSYDQFTVNANNNSGSPYLLGRTEIFTWNDVNAIYARGTSREIFVNDSSMSSSVYNDFNVITLNNTSAPVAVGSRSLTSLEGTSEVNFAYGGTNIVQVADTASTSGAIGTFSQVVAADGGYISSVYGSYSSLGTVGSAVIDTAYGYYSGITEFAGSIGTSYGLYLSNTSGPAIKYGVFQSDADEYNVFNGSMSIGTTSTSSSKLSIQSVGTDDILNLFETGGQEVFTVLENGNVGVGTTTPNAALEINRDSANFTALALTRSGSGAGSVQFDVTTGGTLDLIADGRLQFSTGVSQNTSFTDGTDTNLFIQGATGNVGIGTTSPSEKLTVYDRTGGDAYINVSVEGSINNSNYDAGIKLTNYYGNEWNIWTQGTNSGELYFSDGASTRLTIDNSGNVGIGTSTPTTKLTVAGVITPDADNVYSLGNSSYRFSEVFSANGTINTSDERLKNNVAALSYGLDEVLALEPISFSWIDNPEQGTKLGLIAQDVQSIIPEIVHVGDDTNNTLGVRYTEIIPILINAMQELWFKLEENFARDDGQDLELEYLRERVAALEAALQVDTPALPDTQPTATEGGGGENSDSATDFASSTPDTSTSTSSAISVETADESSQSTESQVMVSDDQAAEEVSGEESEDVGSSSERPQEVSDESVNVDTLNE